MNFSATRLWTHTTSQSSALSTPVFSYSEFCAALAAAPIDSMETAVSVCVYTQHTTLPQRLVR
eukprot:COSAG02_NODE_33028_length_506_cov_2.144963_1_plen_62_part_10